jgi:hypothetical protein
MSSRNTLLIAIASFSLLSACSDDGDNGKKATDSAVVSGDTGGLTPDGNTARDLPAVVPDGSQPQKDAATSPKDSGSKNKDMFASPCGHIPLVGCCDGEVLKWCEEDGKGGYQVQTYDCQKNKLLSCGWSGFSTQAYSCATNGDPEPSGTYPKACP